MTDLIVVRSWAILAVGLLLGCNNQPATYPVYGQVQFPSGAAVRMGTVEARSRELGLNARGAIGPDGSFQLTTFSTDDGAVQGIHDCVIVQMVVTEDIAQAGSAFGVVDPKHGSYKTSGLTIEVQPDSENKVILKVDALDGKELKAKDHKH
jgi:hypothetical protein